VTSDPFVTIAVPVRNGAATIAETVASALEQDHADLEVLIADNASTDDTEDVARALAAADERVRYHRHSHNIGLLGNFAWTKDHARGSYLRWLGDDDRVAPKMVSRCLDEFRADPRLILVTTRLEYLGDDNSRESAPYDATPFRADDPVVRYREMLTLLTRSHLLLDPLYGMQRLAVAGRIDHPRMLHGDEVYAAMLALAGPWGHVDEPLGVRHWHVTPKPGLVKVLEVPAWHRRVDNVLQLRRLLSEVNDADLIPGQRRAARAASFAFYGRRHAVTFTRRGRKVVSSLRPSVHDA
jgi:glycosyltransferase involved in cell wall biosynthesis